MEYNKIIAITGLTGLFELMSSKTDGAIVRSLEDNSTRFVASRIHNFSHLESIEVYTVKDNVNLIEVFNAIEKSQEPLPDAKNNAGVKKYFETVFPDMDFDRVYTSDMKKMLRWYEVLKNKVAFTLPKAPDAEDTSEAGEPVTETASAPADTNPE